MNYKEYIVRVFKDGTKWYNNKDGKLHREDGPAIEWADGSKFWYKNGRLHREDGPACVWIDGTKFWYLNGAQHREDGPAAEYASGCVYWYLNGASLSEEEFNNRMKKPCKIDGKIVEIEGKKYKLMEV